MDLEQLTALRFPTHDPDAEPCPICENRTGTWTSKGHSDVVPCWTCGTYQITGSARAMCATIEPRRRVLLSGFSRDSLLAGSLAQIHSDTVRDSAGWPKPNLSARALRMLRWAVLYVAFKRPSGDRFSPTHPSFKGGSYSEDDHEAARIAALLEELGYARQPETVRNSGGLAVFTSSEWHLTARGHLAAEEQEASQDASPIGFGAMWFHPDMKAVWDQGLSPAIADAGYDPVRVDQVEHLGKIDDEILIQIRRSRFVVADFTGHRSGVYFEAGFALGLGLPVIWTCRRDEMSKLHFDIRQYNCIDWEDAEDLRKRLAYRIEATVGAGPRKSPSP